MGYNFFDRTTTKHLTNTPTVISIKNREDIATLLGYINRLLAKNPDIIKAFSHHGIPHILDISSPQKIMTWLYPATNQLKEIALKTEIDPLTDPNLWFFEAIQKALEIHLNIAQTQGNKRLALKANSASDASLSIDQQPHQTIFSALIQFGCYFDFLNSRASHPTDLALDKACEERKKEQVSRFREENAQIIRLATSSKLDFRNMTTEELENAFIAERSNNPLRTYPSHPYASYREGLEIALTYGAVFAERKEMQKTTVGPEAPHSSIQLGS